MVTARKPAARSTAAKKPAATVKKTAAKTATKTTAAKPAAKTATRTGNQGPLAREIETRRHFHSLPQSARTVGGAMHKGNRFFHTRVDNWTDYARIRLPCCG